LAERAGTELFVRDLAVAMAGLGHEVAAYSTTLGAVAEEIRNENVFVCDRLSEMPWRPDIIHGHHHLDLMTALQFYRGVPAVFVSHGWVPWVEIAPRHPRIIRYFAVDVPTRDAVTRQGIPAERVRLQPNFVDLKRFKIRPPLPPRPRRALVMSNYAHKHLAVVREACAAAGIEVDVCGRDSGRVAERPEELLPNYDIVFAKGRSALEAVTVGNAVIICDRFGVGPMISLKNALQLQSLSGDYQKLYEPLSVEAVARELANYRPDDANGVCRLARSVVGLDEAALAFLRAYEEITRTFPSQKLDDEVEAAADSDYLAWLARYLKANPAILHKNDVSDSELSPARGIDKKEQAKPARPRFAGVPVVGSLVNFFSRRAFRGDETAR
jgi:hypothetical protein